MKGILIVDHGSVRREANDMLEKMFAHNHWANSLAIDFLSGLQNPDPTFATLTAHNLNVEGIWLARIQGRILTDPAERFRDIPVSEMAARMEKNSEALLALLKTDVARIVDYKMFDGTPVSSQIEDLLLHVWSHGVHHRGQMSSKASSLGLKYPDVSFITYSRRK